MLVSEQIYCYLLDWLCHAMEAIPKIIFIPTADARGWNDLINGIKKKRYDNQRNG